MRLCAVVAALINYIKVLLVSLVVVKLILTIIAITTATKLKILMINGLPLQPFKTLFIMYAADLRHCVVDTKIIQ